MNWGTYLQHNDAGKEIPASARALPPISHSPAELRGQHQAETRMTPCLQEVILCMKCARGGT